MGELVDKLLFRPLLSSRSDGQRIEITCESCNGAVLGGHYFGLLTGITEQTLVVSI
ncbi:hypothetical protein D3C87_2066790 [compost metagenome]